MKKVTRKEFLRIAAAAALVCAAASLTGCGKNVEKLVIGDWYLEGSDDLSFMMMARSISRALTALAGGRS